MVSRAPEGTGLYCEIDGLPVEIVPSELTGAGVFVQSTSPPAVDAEVELFLSAHKERLTVRGLVVQVIGLEQAAREKRTPGFGVLFTDLSSTQRQWLERTAQEVRAKAVRARAEALREERKAARMSARKRRSAEREQADAALGPDQDEAPEAESTPQRETIPPGPSDEALRVLGELQAQLDGLRRAPAWKVLGVRANADPATAKDAFLKRSKQFHPHLFTRFRSQEVSKAATELFIVHRKALTTIERTSRASMRPKGQTKAEPPSVPPDKAEGDAARPRKQPRRRSTADAEMAVTEGLRLLAAGDYDEARAQFETAVGLNPESNNAKVWLLLCDARKYKDEGDREQATEAYLAVLELDPKHREALEETRENAPSKRRAGRLLDRWFRSGDDRD